MAGAPMAAAEPAPPLTYTDASGIERPVSEWEGGEADAEEVGLRCANPTNIERAGTAAQPGTDPDWTVGVLMAA